MFNDLDMYSHTYLRGYHDGWDSAVRVVRNWASRVDVKLTLQEVLERLEKTPEEMVDSSAEAFLELYKEEEADEE